MGRHLDFHFNVGDKVAKERQGHPEITKLEELRALSYY